MILIIFLLTILSVIFLYKKPDIIILICISLVIFQKHFRNYIDVEIISSPISLRIEDIGLLLLMLLIIRKLFSETESIKYLFKFNMTVLFFSILVFIYLIVGLSTFGVAAFAEFRFKFYFLIYLFFTVIYFNKYEQILDLLKKLSYLGIFYVLFLAPIRWILEGSISIYDRPMAALTYQTIAMLLIVFFFTKKLTNFKPLINFKVILILFLILSVFSHHRSVWAMMIVQLIFFIVIGYQNRSKLVLGTLFLLSFIVLVFWGNVDFIILRGMGIFDPSGDSTGNWRLLLWNEIINLVMNDNLLGMGLGSRFNVYVPGLGGNIDQGAHNGYVAMLYYLGIPGITFFCILIFTIGYKIFSFYKETKNEIYLLATLGLIGNIIFMLNYESDIVSWVLIGLAISLYKGIKTQKIFNNIFAYR